MKHYVTTVAVVAALLAMLIVIPSAHAAPPEWTTAVSACVPDESSAGELQPGAGTLRVPGREHRPDRRPLQHHQSVGRAEPVVELHVDHLRRP